MPIDHLVAKRGSSLSCHVCKLEIAEARRDIYLGEEIKAEMFRSKTNREIRDGDPLVCPKCKADLAPFGTLLFINEEDLKNDASQLQLPKPQ